VKTSSLSTKKSYCFENMSKYFKIDNILVIGKMGQPERLDFSFAVVVIQNVGELEKGLIWLVNAVRLDLSLLIFISLAIKPITS